MFIKIKVVKNNLKKLFLKLLFTKNITDKNDKAICIYNI